MDSSNGPPKYIFVSDGMLKVSYSVEFKIKLVTYVKLEICDCPNPLICLSGTTLEGYWCCNSHVFH